MYSCASVRSPSGHPVSVPPTLVPAARVPRDWEPMLADGQMLDLHALVDDELLLALPITVRCDRQSCRTAYEEDREQGAPVEDVPDSEKRNPFAALAALKADNSDETD